MNTGLVSREGNLRSRRSDLLLHFQLSTPLYTARGGGRTLVSRGELDDGFMLRGAPSRTHDDAPSAGPSTAPEWRVEPQRNRVARGDEVVHLEPRAMKLLEYLAAADGRVVGKDEFIAEVWEGFEVSDEALTRVICDLRKAFQDDARHPAFIETIHKRGYRLRAHVVLELDDPHGKRSDRKEPHRARGLLWLALVLVVGTSWMIYRTLDRNEVPPAPPKPRLFATVASPGSALSKEEDDLFRVGFAAVPWFQVTHLRPDERPAAVFPGDHSLLVRMPAEGSQVDLLVELRDLSTKDLLKPKYLAYKGPSRVRAAAAAAADEARALGRIKSSSLAGDPNIEPWFDLRRHDRQAIVQFLSGVEETLKYQTGGGKYFELAESLDSDFVAPVIWGLGAFVTAPDAERLQRVELLERFGHDLALTRFEQQAAWWAAHALNGNREEAVRALEYALAEEPGNGPLLINLARMQADHDPGMALETLQGLIDDRWPYPALYPQAADYALRLGRFGAARDLLAMSVEPKDRPIETLALLEALAILDGDMSKTGEYGAAIADRVRESPEKEKTLTPDTKTGYERIIAAAESSGDLDTASRLRTRLKELLGKSN
jgi:DNA-binding winged helix-turn-helix (wHTH) protein